VDDDVVDVSNLQRQVIHTTDRVGVPKVDSAEEAIHALNPDVEVVKYQTRLDASNIMEILDGYDIVVDGVDNFPTRYLLNDASVRLRIPVVSAGDPGLRGPAQRLRPVRGPVLPLPVPPAAAGRARARPAAPTASWACCPGTMGLLQATEVVKLITGAGRAADRPPAHVRRAGATTPSSRSAATRVPDLLARPGRDLRRGDGRLPRLRGLLRGRAGSLAAAWRRSRSPRPARVRRR
jgi:molybdopterin/thiamine biosynthesis adenylyltransferase